MFRGLIIDIRMLKTNSKIEVFAHVQQNDADTRGVRAICNISHGQSLLTEQPIVWILSENSREDHCHHCFFECQSVYDNVCSRCQYVRYCRVDCLKADEDVHKFECPGLKDLSPIVPPGSIRMLARVTQFKYQETSTFKNELPRRGLDFPSKVRELQSNTKHLEKQQFLSGLETFKEYLGQSGVPIDVQVAMEMFGIIECNSFDVVDMEKQSLGSAIYLRASMFNHSCEPNCVAVFDGNVIDIRTLTEIKANQECLISYCELMAPTRERQVKLRDQYQFTCTCNRCVNVKHSVCQESNDIKSDEEVHSNICDVTTKTVPDCTTTTSQGSQEDIEDKSLQMLMQVEELRCGGKYVEGIQLCKKFLERQKSILSSHHYVIVRTLDTLMDLYLELGDNLDKAAEFGEQTLDPYRLNYPTNYPTIGWQLRKVALVYSLIQDCPAQQLDKASELLTEAKQLFLVSHGEQHPLVVDTTNLLEEWTSTLEEYHNESTPTDTLLEK